VNLQLWPESFPNVVAKATRAVARGQHAAAVDQFLEAAQAAPDHQLETEMLERAYRSTERAINQERS